MEAVRQRTKSWREFVGSFVADSTVLMLGLLLVSLSGCYEKNLAPEIEYSPQEVEILRDEIQKMEWD